jgi:hypothetical protein
MNNKYQELEDTILRASKDIAEAKAKLEQLKDQEQQNETWKPYKQGFYIGSSGRIESIDENDSNPHNCFRTLDSAQHRQKQREAEDELFNIWECLVGDWRPNWSENNRKWFSLFDQGRISIGCNSRVPYHQSYRYFPTEELAMKQYEMSSDHAKAYIRGEF